jgi:putative ABC transport system ATP-binding protein
MIEINQISLKISGIEKPILNNISYKIFPRDFIIILGSNGSGKSSLLKCLDSRYHPTSGEIILNPDSKITSLTQNPNDSLFCSLTVFENFLLSFETTAARPPQDKRKFFANFLQEFNPNLSNKLDQLVEQLSGGEKQALALALCVLNPPDVLLLDEHTSALDPKTASQIMALTHRIVTQRNMTCLLTTHDLSVAMQYGNRILAMKNGETYQEIDSDKKNRLNIEDLLSICY